MAPDDGSHGERTERIELAEVRAHTGLSLFHSSYRNWGAAV
jgi:hypothetical protein